jgi:hypothetical protein
LKYTKFRGKRYCTQNKTKFLFAECLNILRWAGDVASTREIRNAQRILVGKHKPKRPLWKPRRGCKDIKGKERILRELGVRACTGFIWLSTGTSGGLLFTR